MDWNDVRFFLALARSGTLAGAARALKVEHTTVGRRLTALETALGAKLFTRSAQGFQLTPAGSDLLPHAEQMEKAAQAVLRRVSGDDARVEGTVRLTASEGISGFVLRHLRPLRERHPALTIELLAGNRSFDLMRGEADVALRMMPTTQPELVQRRVGVLGWSLYAAEGYVQSFGVPRSIADLSGHGVVAFDDSLKAVPGALWLGESCRGARVELRASSTISALNACLAGIGIACIPCFLGDPEATLKRLTSDVLGTREMFVVVHPDLARVARVRTVMDHLTDIMAANADLLGGLPSSERAPGGRA